MARLKAHRDTSGRAYAQRDVAAYVVLVDGALENFAQGACSVGPGQVSRELDQTEEAACLLLYQKSPPDDASALSVFDNIRTALDDAKNEDV